jgi:prepilin-type N-terminal cleavage/methylation domain-containing protein
MKKSFLKKGFTLIELLVVIAIIGILSGIVLTSLNSARTKAKEARAIAGLSQMRTIAEIVADGGSYASLCSGTAIDESADASLPALVADITLQAGVAPICYADASNFCVSVAVTGGAKCVSATSGGDVVCTAADSCNP